MAAESTLGIISVTSHLDIFDACSELIASQIALSARDCPRWYTKHLVMQEMLLVVSKPSKQHFLCAFTSSTCDYGHSQLKEDAGYYPRSGEVEVNNRAIPI